MIASIGAVVGLAFVGYELMQTNAIAREEANSAWAEVAVESAKILTDPTLSVVIAKAMRSNSELTDAETLQLIGALQIYMENLTVGQALTDTGRIDFDYYNWVEQDAWFIFSNPHSQAWWEYVRYGYDPRLAQAVERSISTHTQSDVATALDEISSGREASRKNSN